MISAKAKENFYTFISNHDFNSFKATFNKMVEFYKKTRAEDCNLEEDGDMLLFEWSKESLSIKRQLIVEGKEEEGFWILCVAFYYSQNCLEVKESSNSWCVHPEQIDKFQEEILHKLKEIDSKNRKPSKTKVEFYREC